MPFFRFCVIAAPIFFSAAAFGQDPFTVAPRAYKHQFENAWVRVVRVRYEANEKIASHDHPMTETVYVYLSDSGPVRFMHTGDKRFLVERPPVKVGGFRLGPAAIETHEVTSLSSQPSDFLRVELKTDPAIVRGFRGRYPPDSHATNKSSEKVRFENKKVRITRVTCAAQRSCGNATRSKVPSLLIAVTPARLNADAGGGMSELVLDRGATKWLAAGSSLRLENSGSEPAELLRIEFKTRPANGG